MEKPPSQHRPGDVILNRYMPHATVAEREVARENLRKLARFMLRVEARKAREWREQQIRESGTSEVQLVERSQPPL